MIVELRSGPLSAASCGVRCGWSKTAARKAKLSVETRSAEAKEVKPVIRGCLVSCKLKLDDVQSSSRLVGHRQSAGTIPNAAANQSSGLGSSLHLRRRKMLP